MSRLLLKTKKGIDSVGKPFHHCSGNDDRAAMFK